MSWTWSGKGYPSPSQVKPTQNARQKQISDAAKQASINTYRKQIEGYENDIKNEQKFIKINADNIEAWNIIINSSTNQTEIDNAITQRETQRKEIKASNDRIIRWIKDKNNIQNQINKLINKKPVVPGKPGGSTTNTVTKDGAAVEFSTDYKYNAPLVTGAYLGKGISADSLGGTLDTHGFPITSPVFTDAYNAWRGVNGGRGTIQMDRQYVRSIAEQQKNSLKIDKQMYGFKFLYNPTTVSMGWGVQTMMDPPYMASGDDAFNPISANLITSTVVFEVLLNRIADFNQLNSDGSFTGNNPYGQTDVPVEERKQIYDRGTMYDLEYFFKTINGPRATFTSRFNGLTADAGWLLPASLELHLGAGMRYRIRINEVSINHILFNNRMVPTLSSVRFVCGRYNDGPGKPLDEATASGGGGTRTNAVVL
jgi:hypothetical protein